MVRKRLISNLLKISSCFFVVLIVSSFMLHALQISHGHYGLENDHHAGTHTGEKNATWLEFFSEYMHASEKKLLLLIEPAPLLYSGTIALLYGTWIDFLSAVNLFWLVWWKRKKKSVQTEYSFLVLFLAQGVLNPKLY